jgi:ABC-type multidrug transport system permease subunit
MLLTSWGLDLGRACAVNTSSYSLLIFCRPVRYTNNSVIIAIMMILIMIMIIIYLLFLVAFRRGGVGVSARVHVRKPMGL